jgi:RNA polymerase sigma-70 factor (ECF subfamily)
MSMDARNPAIGLPFPTSSVAERIPLTTSELENEVITLFDRFRSRLLRYVLSFGIPIHDGEEIIQEVFLSLFQHLQRGRSRRNLDGWIFRVAHNLALKQRTSNQRAKETVALESSMVERHLDPGPNPEQQMNNCQRRERLFSVLRALPEQEQRCLFLRVEGLRYREIASVLGMSLGAVSISLTRSLARLERADIR